MPAHQQQLCHDSSSKLFSPVLLAMCILLGAANPVRGGSNSSSSLLCGAPTGVLADTVGLRGTKGSCADFSCGCSCCLCWLRVLCRPCSKAATAAAAAISRWTAATEVAASTGTWRPASHPMASCQHMLEFFSDLRSWLIAWRCANSLLFELHC